MRAIPILVTLGAVAVAAPTQVMAQDFEWSGRLSAGQAIEVKGINGDIEAMVASGNQVEVTAVKKEGRRGDPDAGRSRGVGGRRPRTGRARPGGPHTPGLRRGRGPA